MAFFARTHLFALVLLILCLALGAPALAQTTVTLQDGVNGYTGTTDAWIWNGAPDTNTNGTTWGLRGNTNAVVLRLPIFQAEGGPVPNGATITSATLSVYKFWGPDGIFKAERLLRAWQETQVTWNSAATGTPWATPGALGNADVTPTGAAQGSIGTAEGWVNFDVTAPVQAMAGGGGNYGWRLQQTGGNTNPHDFIAANHPNQPTLRPKLTVTYSTTQPPSGGTTLQNGLNGYTGTADAWIWNGAPDTNTNGTTWGLRGNTNAVVLRLPIFQAEGGPVPNGATITSATLSVYKFWGPDGIFKAERLLRAWQETQVTWNSATTGTPWATPGALGNADVTPTGAAQGSIGTAEGWVNFDVTAPVQAMAGGAGNYGWRLQQTGGNTNPHDFIAANHPNQPTLRPKLTVTYTGGSTGPTAPTAALSASPNPGIGPLTVTFSASGSSDGGSPITGLRLQFGHIAQEVTWTDKNETKSYTYPAGAATYTPTLTVTNAVGTSAPKSQTITVTTGDVPTARFIWSRNPGTRDVTFNVSGSSEGSASITSLRLQFGDGQEVTWNDKNLTQTHTYAAFGPYTPVLTATNSHGTSAPYSEPIQVTDPNTTPPGGGTCAPNPDFLHSFESSITENGAYSAQRAADDRIVLVDSPRRHGSKAIKFTTSGNDTNINGSNEWERTELRMGTALSDGVEGREQWWAHSTYFPDNFQFPPSSQPWDNSLFVQWHDSNDSGGQPNLVGEIVYEGGSTPGLVMRFRLTHANGDTRRYAYNRAAPEKNVWYDFVYHVKWSSGSGGFAKVWVRKDGESQGHLVMDYTGPTIYPNNGVYFKIGTYHPKFPNAPGSVIHDCVAKGGTVDEVRWFPLENVP